MNLNNLSKEQCQYLNYAALEPYTQSSNWLFIFSRTVTRWHFSVLCYKLPVQCIQRQYLNNIMCKGIRLFIWSRWQIYGTIFTCQRASNDVFVNMGTFLYMQEMNYVGVDFLLKMATGPTFYTTGGTLVSVRTSNLQREYFAMP